MRYVMKEKLWSFGDDFTIKDAEGHVPGPNDYDVTGDFFDHEYAFHCSGREVARVSKRFFSWTDTYGIDVADGEDDVTILATAVVIDLVCHAADDD